MGWARRIRERRSLRPPRATRSGDPDGLQPEGWQVARDRPRIGSPRPEQRSPLDPIIWTGSEVVFSTGADPSAGVVRYSPTTGRWKASAAPCSGSTQIAWIGDRLAE
jgi:hypothetical protein